MVEYYLYNNESLYSEVHIGRLPKALPANTTEMPLALCGAGRLPGPNRLDRISRYWTAINGKARHLCLHCKRLRREAKQRPS